MRIGEKEIIVVGDRVLIRPDKPEEQTRAGLYLPQTVIAKEPVQIGKVMEVGPGIALPNPPHDVSEPWKETPESPTNYIPLQVEPVDVVLFIKKEAVDIKYDDEDYIVVPQSAVLLIIRGEE